MEEKPAIRTVRILPAGEHGHEDDLHQRTPGERIEMIEQITRDAYAFVKGGPELVERRLQRRVVRLFRGGR